MQRLQRGVKADADADAETETETEARAPGWVPRQQN